MPYKNKEDAFRRSREYQIENREEINKRQNERYHNLSEEKKVERRAKRKQWEQDNKAEINAKS